VLGGRIFMTSRWVRALVSVSVVVLACAGAAFAAGPLGGRTYQGSVPSRGVDHEGHHVKTHAAGKITLHVASNGRSVTVHFSSASPVLYCVTQEQVHVQTSKRASISSSGKFTAKVDERFAAGPGAPSIVQVVTGQFSGGTVTGQIRTQAPPCSGVSRFSASAH
jgi:hypothetical protein